MHRKKKQLYKMTYIFGKSALDNLCFTYLKMIISTKYALKPVFPKALFQKIYGFKGCAKKHTVLKIQIARLSLNETICKFLF